MPYDSAPYPLLNSKLSLSLSWCRPLLISFLAGLLLAFSFAPFRYPGLAVLGMAMFFDQLRSKPGMNPFYQGLSLGLGWMGLGVSWVYVSVHEFGHFDPASAALVTALFVAYLALFPAAMAWAFERLSSEVGSWRDLPLFAALWCLSEWLRSNLMTGFPWLLLGFGQTDSPLQHLLPLVGVYGVGFVTCLAAAFLAMAWRLKGQQQRQWLSGFVGLMLLPLLLKPLAWSKIDAKS